MELFHFDIETCGAYPNLENLRLNDIRGFNLFMNKYKKMNWSDKYTPEEAYLEFSPIVSTWGKICCISFGTRMDGELKIMSHFGDNEKELLEDFNKSLKKIESKDYKLSGFRIIHFDIPWILHKMHKWEIKPADIILSYDKKPWEMRIVDMADDWKGRFAWQNSFDEMCYELGVDSSKTEMSGNFVHKVYWSSEPNRLDEIRRYCESDVRSSILCGEKIYG